VAADTHWDVIVVGAGAAGLFCASVAGQRGQRVLVLDHAKTLGEKIRISGGGRCNFTNIHSGPEHFLSLNPHFVKSALARYTAKDFVRLVKQHRISFHEKHRGQLFCDDHALQIVNMLKAECALGQVVIRHPVSVHDMRRQHAPQLGWRLETSAGSLSARQLVMATGGLPVPAIGATGFSLETAKKFDLPVVAPRPGLVPLSFTSESLQQLTELSGLSLPVGIRAGKPGQRYGQGHFEEDLLLTHKGLSGPAVLQASSYWQEGEAIEIQWLDDREVSLLFEQPDHRTKQTETMLAQHLPQRLAKALAATTGLAGRKWAEVGRKDRAALKDLLTAWSVKPAGTLGWKKAEVMLGGVDTRALDHQTMMALAHPGLYFIGECVDVTGHLGGHNFQWAWASGYACGQGLVPENIS